MYIDTNIYPLNMFMWNFGISFFVTFMPYCGLFVTRQL